MYDTDLAFLIRLTDIGSFVGSGKFVVGDSVFVVSRRTRPIERLGIWL